MSQLTETSRYPIVQTTSYPQNLIAVDLDRVERPVRVCECFGVIRDVGITGRCASGTIAPGVPDVRVHVVATEGCVDNL